jgi:quinol monooxygenase YgiN
MIVIHVQAKVKADKRQEFLNEVHKDLETSRAFAGCVQFGWAEDVARPNAFTLYEEWDSAEAFKTYRESDHFKQVGSIILPMFAEEPASTYYTANTL